MDNFSNFQSAEGPIRKNDPELEARLHLERGFGQLRATYRWFSWKRFFIYLPGTITFLFFGSIFFWFYITSSVKPGLYLFLVIMSLGLLIIGLRGIYQSMAVLINHTTIEVTSQLLTTNHGPLPYPGNRSIQYSDLKEIRTEETSKAGVSIFLPIEGYGGELTPKATIYQLRATLKDSRKFDLVYGSDENVIRYLEAVIVEHLHLKDFDQTATTEVVPAGLQVQQGFNSFQATYRWFSWKELFLYLIVSFFFLPIAFMMWPAPNEQPDIFTRLFAFVSPLVVLFGIYKTLTIMFNHTTIEVSDGRLCVRIGPLPYPGNRSVACADLQELIVFAKDHKSDTPATYELDAILKQGGAIKVWSNASRETLDYLKQAIERQLSRQNLTIGAWS